MSSTARAAIYAEIEAEDVRQTTKGRTAERDDARSPFDWLDCLRRVLSARRMVVANTVESPSGRIVVTAESMPAAGIWDAENTARWRKTWLKVARLAISAVESVDRRTTPRELCKDHPGGGRRHDMPAVFPCGCTRAMVEQGRCAAYGTTGTASTAPGTCPAARAPAPGNVLRDLASDVVSLARGIVLDTPLPKVLVEAVDRLAQALESTEPVPTGRPSLADTIEGLVAVAACVDVPWLPDFVRLALLSENELATYDPLPLGQVLRELPPERLGMLVGALGRIVGAVRAEAVARAVATTAGPSTLDDGAAHGSEGGHLGLHRRLDDARGAVGFFLMLAKRGWEAALATARRKKAGAAEERARGALALIEQMATGQGMAEVPTDDEVRAMLGAFTASTLLLVVPPSGSAETAEGDRLVEPSPAEQPIPAPDPADPEPEEGSPS